MLLKVMNICWTDLSLFLSTESGRKRDTEERISFFASRASVPLINFSLFLKFCG